MSDPDSVSPEPLRIWMNPPVSTSSSFTVLPPEAASPQSREAAFRVAGELFRDLVLEPSPDDLMMVADWLLSGSADLAVRFSESRARSYALGQTTQ